ncbi:ABC transporter substrate-binding protein [Thalassolituus sp. LLYu03]|uniref:ABC transporter substrate-binding protein n=1 Tax=Thalassolituus sp. LLYu03 TaxID=3421656 RepID=UPI003D2B4771
MTLTVTLLATAGLLPAPALAGPPYQVSVIQSYHPEYNWDAQYLQALQDEMGERCELTAYSMDTKHLPKSEWPQKADDIAGRIARNKPDLVVIGDDNAFSLMATRVADMNIPVVFLGVNGGESQYPQALHHPLITGVLERPFFEQNVRHMRKVLRHDQRFLILTDDSPTMNNAIGEYFGDTRSRTIHGTQVDVLMTNSREQWLHAIASAADAGTDAIIIGTHHTIYDHDGQYAKPDELMAEAWATAPVPIFSLWDIFVGDHKAAGGFTVSAYQEGVTASRLALMILNGTPVSSIEPMKSLSGHFVYSRKAMEHWHIRLSSLTASQTAFIE